MIRPPARADLDARQLQKFEAQLRSHARLRVPLDTIWRIFARSFPNRPPGAGERAWLLRCLEFAAEDGVIRLPPPTGTRWERAGGTPRLPTSVDRVRTEAAADEVRAWKSRAWHPRLLWVLDLSWISPRQEEFLDRVHQGLVEDSFSSPAPFRHRSLELTGSEKGLEPLLGTQLFGEGRLSLEMLGVEREVLPFAWERVGAGPLALALENASPFQVARRQALATRSSIGMVIYGAGAAFRSSVLHLGLLEEPPEAVLYVGDLDDEGMAIPQDAAVLAREKRLPPILPATAFHEAMLDAAAALGYPDGWPCAGSAECGALSFLETAVAPRVRGIIESGGRIPEEVLGPQAFRCVLEEMN